MDKDRSLDLDAFIAHHERAIEFTDYSEPSKNTVKALEEDDVYGAACLPLITDFSWIERRVEQVEIIDEGETRRQISFDMALPYNAALSKPEGVHVPLTYLRKGMLTNLSLQDGTGTPLVSMRFSENAQISYQAIRVAMKPLGLKGALLNEGIYSVVTTAGKNDKALDGEDIVAAQEINRHGIFSSLAQLASMKRTGCGSSLRFLEWIKDLNLEEEHGEFTIWDNHVSVGGQAFPITLDSFRPVHVLMLELLKAIHGTRDEKRLTNLELVCIMLATASISYMFAAIIPEEVLWNGKKPRRTLVKFSCDVEVNNDITDEQRVEQRIVPRLKHAWREPTTNLKVRYTTQGARSTHLEVLTPLDIVVQDVKAERPPTRALMHGPTIYQNPITSNVRLGAEACRYVHNVRDSEGTYRASQMRVHVMNLEPRTTLNTLNFQIHTPKWLQALGAALLGTLSSAFTAAALGLKEWNFVELADFLALITLVTALAGAFIITGTTNRILREASTIQRDIINVSSWVAISVPFMLLIPIFLGSLPTPVRVIGGLVATAGGVVCAGLLLLALRLYRKTRHTTHHNERKVMETAESVKAAGQNTEEVSHIRNVVAATETGPYDCDYLNTYVLTNLGHADLKNYITHLQKTAKEL